MFRLEGLRDFGMSVMVCSVIILLCEFLAPPGALKKSLRLISGLVLLLTVASPLSGSLFGFFPEFDLPEGADYEALQNNLYLNEVKSTLAGEIEDKLYEMGIKVYSVRIDISVEDSEVSVQNASAFVGTTLGDDFTGGELIEAEELLAEELGFYVRLAVYSTGSSLP